MMANYGNNNKKSTPPTPASSYGEGPPPSLNGDMSALGFTSASTGIDPQFGYSQFGSFGPPPPKPASNISRPLQSKPKTGFKQQLPDHTEPWKQEGQVEQQGLNGDVSALGFTSGVSGIEPMREGVQTLPLQEGTFTPQWKRKARRPTDDYGTGPNNSRTQRKKSTVTTGLSSGYSDNW
jgi:hypothetical protein